MLLYPEEEQHYAGHSKREEVVLAERKLTVLRLCCR
ncbi:hypothetical protein TIFTF001_018293 [Ficus carica]|uniref:Uncharacterized protein n=1 Tax=Ficus carica TaxID=3494 RepID=A0AA88D944_FICCA|nr:hypothetical protein TIFTF001_018293 [Ficus carica]